MRVAALAAFMVLSIDSVAFADAQARKERYARVDAEWEKLETRNERICIGDGSIVLSYGVYDRTEFRPVLFSPGLADDLFATLASRIDASKDASVRDALAGPFNAALNEKLALLRDGHYNQITVHVKKGASFWITPGEHQSESVLVWVPRIAGADFVVAGKVDPRIPIYVLAGPDSFAPMDKTTRPSWLTTAANIYEASGGNLSAERKRAKLLVDCD
jgi:hypothetical protein